MARRTQAAAASTADAPFAVVDWPANHVKMWRLDRIIPYPGNPKMHPPEQITLLAHLMLQHGVDQPIVVDEDGVILKGHGRRLSAIEAKFEQFPIVQRHGLSEPEKRAMRVADNQLALMAGWNPELIRLEVSALKLSGYDVNLLGFGQQELVQFETNIIPGVPPKATGSLADKFGIVPFSVLNAREGVWQDRKRAWLALGIKSELGRGDNLIGRSIFDRVSMVFGGHYSKIKAFVDRHRASGKTDDEIEQLAIAANGSASSKKAMRDGIAK